MKEEAVFLKFYNRPALEWQMHREEAFYRALNGSQHFPQFVRCDEEGLWMTHCGKSLAEELPKGVSLCDVEQQMEEILEALQDIGIRHRDITVNNLSWKGGVLYLLDFGWAIWSEEYDSPIPVPSVMRPWMCDKTDRQQADETIARLEKVWPV